MKNVDIKDSKCINNIIDKLKFTAKVNGNIISIQFNEDDRIFDIIMLDENWVYCLLHIIKNKINELIYNIE